MLKEPSRRAYVQNSRNEPVSRTYKLDLSPMEAGRGFHRLAGMGEILLFLGRASKQVLRQVPRLAANPVERSQLLSSLSNVQIWSAGDGDGRKTSCPVAVSAEKLNTVREFGRTPYNSETLLTATSSGDGKIGIESHGGLVKRFGRVRGSWGYGSSRACE